MMSYMRMCRVGWLVCMVGCHAGPVAETVDAEQGAPLGDGSNGDAGAYEAQSETPQDVISPAPASVPASPGGGRNLWSQAPVPLDLEFPVGSAQQVIERVAGPHTIATERWYVDDPDALDVSVRVEHREGDSYGSAWVRSFNGVDVSEPESWTAAQSQLFIPVHVELRARDGWLDETWDDAVVVVTDAEHAYLEHKTVALQGSLGFEDLSTAERGCDVLELIVEFGNKQATATLMVGVSAGGPPCLAYGTTPAPGSPWVP